MSRFIAVIHAWHVDSMGFESHELDTRDPDIAEGSAALLAMRAQGTCRKTDYHLVEIEDRERLVSRRLTWRERLTGMLEVKP